MEFLSSGSIRITLIFYHAQKLMIFNDIQFYVNEDRSNVIKNVISYKIS
jgi:hypothetical protein